MYGTVLHRMYSVADSAPSRQLQGSPSAALRNPGSDAQAGTIVAAPCTVASLPPPMPSPKTPAKQEDDVPGRAVRNAITITRSDND